MIKAIVTGHTRGLGACLTAELLSRGATVLGIARRRNVELELQYGPKLDHIELDLSSLHEAEQWIASDALAHFLSGSETVLLINNAATAQPLGAAPDLDIHSISRTITLNISVPIMLASAVMASGATASDKRILHLSSGAGRSAYPGLCVYGATKAALDHHAKSVALDKVANLRICSLAPGVIDTDMQAGIRSSTDNTFSMREAFVALKREGKLADAGVCANRIVDYLLGESFGENPLVDM